MTETLTAIREVQALPANRVIETRDTRHETWLRAVSDLGSRYGPRTTNHGHGLPFSPMHEIGIARSVIDVAVAAVPEGGTLSGVTVTIGPMSGVVADSLQFGFEVASKGTPAEGAELEIVEVPLVVHCSACGAGREIEDTAMLSCPECAGTVTVVSGNETLVTSVRYAEA